MQLQQPIPHEAPGFLEFLGGGFYRLH